jgi:DNA-binding transcriptional ArsR family regulator
VDEVFRAISEPTRRALLDRLNEGEASVGELSTGFDVTLSAISQHMKVLKDAGLVAERRAGRHRYYRVTPSGLRTVAEWVAHYERFWTGRLDALGTYLRRSRK